MARKAVGLTAAAVKTAKPGRYGDGNGLYLLVRPSRRVGEPAPDGRFWLFRYTPKGGKMREIGLGRAGYGKFDVPLTDARDQAAELIKQVRAGVDPLAKREADDKAARAEAQRAKLKAITFREVAEKFMDAHEAGLRNAKHRMQWRNTMATYAYPVMGEIPVAEIETSHVLAVLEPIWRVKPETASRVRGRIESVLDYARALGWRSTENAGRWKGHLSNMLPARSRIAPVEHHAALPWPQIGDFFQALRGQAGVAALVLQFTILTAARSGETLGARWSEIDLSARVWTIPGARMKAGKEHRVPLTDAAIRVLKAAQGLRQKSTVDEYVFPGAAVGRPLSVMAMAMVLRRMGRGELTVHGFRSSFRDWAAERTSYPAEVVEMALAHAVGNRVEAAYRRGDLFEKRGRLMREWATFCAMPSVERGGVRSIGAPAA
jgi:integrase